MSPPKYVDLFALAAALVVFVVADLPMVGFAAGAGAWLAQRGIQVLAARRASEALANGNRQKAMGMIAATTLGRVWLMATVVLVVGLARRTRGRARRRAPGPRPLHDLLRRPGDRPPVRARRREEPREDENQSPDRARRLPGDRDPDAADLRQRRQERRVQAAERVQARTVGLDPPRQPRPEHQQGGPLPRPRQRPDDLRDGLDLPPHGAEAEPRADRGRGLLRPDQEHDHRRQPRRRRRAAAGSPSSPRSSSGSGSRT